MKNFRKIRKHENVGGVYIHTSNLNKREGITLIALVITIIILLILAGITLATLTGDNGLFTRAKQARQNTIDSQERENLAIGSYENAINEVLDETVESSREQITVDKEQYEQLLRDVEDLKHNSISSDSLLLTANSVSKTRASFNLTSFDNNYESTFEQYFSYNSTTGELTCLKDGWYGIGLDLRLGSNANSTDTIFTVYINNVNIMYVHGFVNAASTWACDNNFSGIFIKDGDIIKVEKNTSGTADAGSLNYVAVNLYRL